MVQRVFIKVLGFTDVERHALNTVFRLSEQRATVYSLWQPDAPEPPRLALIDAQCYEARLELEAPAVADLKLIWIGNDPPQGAWRVFDRPLSWPDVVQAMDELLDPADVLDFDLDIEVEVEADVFSDTEPPAALPPDTQPPDDIDLGPPRKRALIASADRDERLYLRARLALADLTQADDAETGAQALELARAHHYDVVLVDFGLPDVEGWAFLKELMGARPAIPHVIMTKAGASLGERLRAWFGGAKGFLGKPPHPGKLRNALQKV